jgi:hypothetical protein
MKRVEDAKNRESTVDIIEADFTEKEPLPADRKQDRRGDA